MSNKALMGFVVSVAGVVAGLYVYNMLKDDSSKSSNGGTGTGTGTGAGAGMTPFRGRRR